MKKGSTAVGVRGAGCVVLGVEKKAVAKLQEDRTVRKICQLDDHVNIVLTLANPISSSEGVDGLRWSHRRRSCPDKASQDRVPEPQAHRRGPCHFG